MERAQRNYVLVFDTNGTFRVENVQPGDYTLYMSVTNPERPDNYYEHIGSLNKQVTIPAAPAGKLDEPFDIGEVELPIRGTMKIGRRAPQFEVKTFDGKAVKLDDFKGKFVLLDFWATWAGSRTFDLQMLKSLHETYGKDGRLVMLGLNFDHESKTAETAITQGGLKWTQCYAGSWNQTRLPASYGVQGLPEAILIDPEGKIVGKSLRGSTIRTTVRRFLADPRSASAKP
jgi:peroxiredoxin